MITKKVSNRICNVIAYYAARGYIESNYKNGKRRYKKHHPYSIGAEGEEALEAHQANDEGRIKRIILDFMFTHDDINLDMDCYHNDNFFCRYHRQKQKAQ